MTALGKKYCVFLSWDNTIQVGGKGGGSGDQMFLTENAEGMLPHCTSGGDVAVQVLWLAGH